MVFITPKARFVQVSDNEFVGVNLLSGAVDLFSSDEMTEIHKFRDSGNSSILSTDLLKGLMSRGYIYNTSLDEETAFRKIIDDVMGMVKINVPYQPMIIPSYSCNFACTYCYEGKLTTTETKVISEEQILSYLTALESIQSHVNPYDLSSPSLNFPTKFTIGLYGGEPLLSSSIERVYFLMDKAKELLGDRVTSYSAVTNGSTMPEYAKELAKRKLTLIQITLDGSQEYHDRYRVYKNGRGSYHDVVSGVTEALRNGISVMLRINIDRKNIIGLSKFSEEIENRWGKYLKCNSPDSKNAILTPYIGMVEDMTCSGSIDTIENMTEAFHLIDKLLTDSPEIFNVITIRVGAMKFGFPMMIADDIFVPKFRACDSIGSGFICDPYDNIYSCWELVGNKDAVIGKYHPNLCFNEQAKRWTNRILPNMPKCMKCESALVCAGGCAGKAQTNLGDFREPYCEGMNGFDDAIKLLWRLRKMKIPVT